MSKINRIPRLISLLMTSQGLKQVQVAKKLKVAPSHLNNYLKGHADVRAEFLADILAQVGVDLEAVLAAKLAESTGLSLQSSEKAGGNLESLIRSLAPNPRRVLVGYLRRYMKESLHSSYHSQVETLRQLAQGGANDHR